MNKENIPYEDRGKKDLVSEKIINKAIYGSNI